MKYSLKMLIAFVALLFIVILIAAPIIIPNDGYSIEASVESQLAIIRNRIEEFRNENKRYPLPGDEVNNFFMETGLRRNDLWESPIHYELSNGVLIIYSYGENMIDDKGLQDDIFPIR